MEHNTISRSRFLASAPPPWPRNLLGEIRRSVAASPVKLVILDDDPTGTQTVHGLHVLTTWSVAALQAELQKPAPGFFILTNSRSLTPSAAKDLARTIGANLSQAAADTGIPLQVISRSDSTLRGHFPGEVDALLDAMGTPDLPRILAPCFFEGGRLTANDIHYVAEGDQLIPAAQTPYARDAVFGYRHSHLRDWVVEKTRAAVPREFVSSISLTDIRQGGPQRVAERLLTLGAGSYLVVNALTYGDLDVFTAGLLAAEGQGRQFVFRSAASLVRVRAGIVPRDLLGREELVVDNGHGGLFVAGSYVPKTTAQLAALRAEKGLAGIEIKVTDLLDERRQAATVASAAEAAGRALAQGRDTVLYTSRDLVKGTGDAENLDIGQRVSESLVAIVEGITCQPRYLVAKGGITSSDVATQALNIRRAEIMGQALPGVPVWRLGPETRWPGTAYIIFPGNVGDNHALAGIRQRLAPPQP